VTFYATMAVAGFVVDVVFDALGLVPTSRNAKVVEAHISLNYTTVLNVLFLLLASVLVIRFFRTGGTGMLKAMNRPIEASDAHAGHGPAIEERIETLQDEHNHSATEEPVTYTCPMHPEIRSGSPGRCPRCGMDLQPSEASTGNE
jgi:hypothetical protein